MKKKIPLEQWDREVKPKLQSIKIDAGWIQYYVKKIVQSCRELAIRPEWETQAQEEIETTIAAFEEALRGLKAAREIYLSKPQN